MERRQPVFRPVGLRLRMENSAGRESGRRQVTRKSFATHSPIRNSQTKSTGRAEMPNNNRKWHKRALCVAMGMSLSLLALSTAQAQSDDGSVVGRTTAGATVTVTSPATGLTRSVTADAKGSYRFPFLPVGQYSLEASK